MVYGELEDRVQELEAELAIARAELAVRNEAETELSSPLPVILEESPLIRLDLGSGPRPKEGFHGVDIVEGVARYTHDLCSGERWPFEDDSVDEMHSSHFIEHIDAVYIRPHTGPVRKAWVSRKDGIGAEEVDIGLGPRIDALLFFFDEAYRIAKPGAVFTVIWPALKSVRAFQDPTHRRFIPAETIGYLSRAGREAMGVTHYGATCNWIGDVTFNVVMNPDDQKEQEAMALLSDVSDKKQAYAKEQQRRYVESWDRGAHDFIATLRCVKP